MNIAQALDKLDLSIAELEKAVAIVSADLDALAAVAASSPSAETLPFAADVAQIVMRLATLKGKF